MSVAISSIFSGGREIAVDRHQALFFTGDRVRLVFMLTEGAVDLIRHSETGTRMRLHRALAGYVLAEASVYSHTYHCDGIAVSDAKLVSLPVAEFSARLDREPALSRAWAAHLAGSLQSARASAEIRSLRTVAERLDAWLDGRRPLPPKGQWQTLAQTLGVTREALYRELARRRR